MPLSIPTGKTLASFAGLTRDKTEFLDFIRRGARDSPLTADSKSL
jgi:hypothetical protein